MKYMEYINNQSIMGIIQRVFQFVDPRLIDHGLRVSYLVWRMLHPLGRYSPTELRDISFLAILHDIGAYKTEEINRMLNFETDSVWEHSIYGYLFLRYFSPLKEQSLVVLLHHVSWADIKNQEELSDRTKEVSQALFLADRLDVAMDVEKLSWEEALKLVAAESGYRFCPDVVAIAESLTMKKALRDELLEDEQYYRSLSNYLLSQAQITDYLKMIIFSIDFRSRHTVTHTVTTTSISWDLARIMGLDEDTCNRIVCGALLHDIGKVGIPVEILEFPGRLSPQAMSIMRTHVEIGDQIFNGEIEEKIRRIALRHHEKLNGTGYPLGLNAEELNTPERIVAVADIVSALSGTRSYKDAYDQERIVHILTGMKADGLIDPDIVDTTITYYDEIMKNTRTLCDPLIALYHRIQSEYQQLLTAHSTGEIIHQARENVRLGENSYFPDLFFPHDA